MIHTNLGYMMTSLIITIDALETKIAVCEHNQGATEEVMTFKASIAELRKHVDYLISTDISMVFVTKEIQGMTQIPYNKTREEYRTKKAANHKSEAEADKEILEEYVDAAFRNMSETEELLIDVVVQDSLENALFWIV